MTQSDVSYSPRKRTWNGYGLSFWRCKCGAARRVTHLRVENDACVGRSRHTV